MLKYMNKTHGTSVSYSLLFPAAAEILTIYRSCPTYSEESNSLSKAIAHVKAGACKSCSHNVRVFKDFSGKF